jgi:flagellar P-ring protein FlgI
VTRRRSLFTWVIAIGLSLQSTVLAEVRLKDLGHFIGWRDNHLIGYGIVTGLAGSGDSPRNRATRQALANLLSQMGMSVPQDQLQSRNIAIVMVTATLAPAANVGDKMDVTATSIGDARSLAGGSLMMTPLLGPDRRTYALAQGALLVGGYRFDANINLRQKNYPTVGALPDGATVEVAVQAEVLKGGALMFSLKNADMTTAQRVMDAINARLGQAQASVRDASAVRIALEGDRLAANQMIAALETLSIIPDQPARVVINERTGTVVAGGDVQMSSVVISQGDIKVSVTTDNYASQPSFIGGTAPDVRSLIVLNSKLDVAESGLDANVRFPTSTIADLVQGLAKMKVGTRDMISILNAIKAAGALHADIIIQ